MYQSGALLIFLMLISSGLHQVKSFYRGAKVCRAMSVKSATKTWILNYEYVTDILEKRAPYREAHLKLATDLKNEGLLISGGPVLEGEKPTGAVFLFHSPSKAVVESFVAADPYCKAGLVPSFSIKEYSVVIGSITSKL